jgi:hypothetical protein
MCAICVQYVYNMCTICVQYVYNMCTICVQYPLHLNITGTFLYRCFLSLLSIATPLLVATLFHFFLPVNNILHVCSLLPQKKFISRYVSSDSFAKIFCLSISLRLSFTIFVIYLKVHSCCFVYTNANPIL